MEVCTICDEGTERADDKRHKSQFFHLTPSFHKIKDSFFSSFKTFPIKTVNVKKGWLIDIFSHSSSMEGEKMHCSDLELVLSLQFRNSGENHLQCCFVVSFLQMQCAAPSIANVADVLFVHSNTSKCGLHFKVWSYVSLSLLFIFVSLELNVQ